MADNVFRPRRPNNQPEEHNETSGEENLEMVEKVRNQVSKDDENPLVGGNFGVGGKIPQGFIEALKKTKNQQEGSPAEPKRNFEKMNNTESVPVPRNTYSVGSGHLKEILEGLKSSTNTFEEIELPSKGKFYDHDGPQNGIVSIRPMTGEEEQILATPRLVRKGQAINMIFQKCIKEQIRPESLLTVDRTYLLIYLRGISYSPSYDVEIKCPECERKFGTTIDLNSLYVESCPDDYGPVLQDVLPTSKLPFSYRLSTGKDEQEITDYRDRKIKAFGDSSADDTLIYRTSVLLNDIDGITNKTELQILLKNLPIGDVSYIRNCINEPPFGVDTNVEIVCPSCLQDFEVDLPLEANFFFPRRKKTKTQA
jgi:T4 bacteriophage base plate protein